MAQSAEVLSECFLEKSNDIEENNKKIDSGSSSEGEGSGAEDPHSKKSPPALAFSSQQWPQRYCWETIDSYSISASPKFGSLGRRSSPRYSFYEVNSNDYLHSDAKTSFLSKEESFEEKDDSKRISIAQLSWSEKASLHEHLSGELPVSHGCSFSQTIFKGLVMALIGSLLSILVAIIMPSLCFMKILGKKATRTQMIISMSIVMLGIISAVLGTYSSVSEIANQY